MLIISSNDHIVVSKLSWIYFQC